MVVVIKKFTDIKTLNEPDQVILSNFPSMASDRFSNFLVLL